MCFFTLIFSGSSLDFGIFFCKCCKDKDFVDPAEAGNWPTNARPVLEKVNHAYVIFYLVYITIIVSGSQLVHMCCVVSR